MPLADEITDFHGSDLFKIIITQTHYDVNIGVTLSNNNLKYLKRCFYI